jgi:hypothetical protein
MKFDQYAREAGNAVLAAARQAEPPPILGVQARDRRFNLIAASLVVTAVVIAAGVVSFWPNTPDIPLAVAQSTTTTASPSSTEPQETSTTLTTTTTVDTSARDAELQRVIEITAGAHLVDRFVEFAKNPNAETFSSLPLADSVALGLGPQVVRSVEAEQLQDPETWILDVEEFRAYTGPFSSLSLLGSLDHYTVEVGEHPHCVGPPQPPPDGLEDYKRISVQPLEESMDSCLTWLTVDLFVNPSGQVEAITMDLWEP